jgi:hypothetical protein
MKTTIAAAIAALLLPLPAAAQWQSNGWQDVKQRIEREGLERRIGHLESQQRQQQGFYQTRYQCGSSFYQCH